MTSAALLESSERKADAKGEFTVDLLPVGTYQVLAEAGSKGGAQAGVRIRLAETVRIKLTLEPKAPDSTAVAAETSNGTGAPVIDPTATTAGERVTYEELIRVPTARDPWAVLSLVPGMQSDRFGFGGVDPGQPTMFAPRGLSSSLNRFMIDGLNISDQSAIGSTPTYYGFGEIEDVQLGISGTQALNSGFAINVLQNTARSTTGGNAWFAYEDVTAPEPLNSVNPNRITNRSTSFGGDFGTAFKNRIASYGAYSQTNVTANARSAGENFVDDAAIKAALVRLTWQMTPKMRSTIAAHFDDRTTNAEGIAFDKTFDSAAERSGTAQIIDFLQQMAFTDTIVNARLSFNPSAIDLVSNGFLNDQAAIPVQNAAGVFDRAFATVETERPRTSVSADVMRVFRRGDFAHQFGGSFTLDQFHDRTRVSWPNSSFTVVDNVAQPIHVRPLNTNTDIAFLDTLASVNYNADMNRLSLSARFDISHQSSTNEPSSTEANPLNPTALPAINFAGSDGPVVTTFSPSVSLGYSLGENSVIRGAFSEVAAPITTQQVAVTNAFSLIPTNEASEAFRFGDVNGNAIFDSNEQRGASVFVLFPPTDPRFSQPRGLIDPDFEIVKVRSVTGGFDHRAGRGGLHIDMTVREIFNLSDRVPMVSLNGTEARPAVESDYIATAPVQTTNALGESVTVTPFRLAPGTAFTGGAFLTNTGRTASAFDVTIAADRSFARNAYLKGWLNFGRSKQHVPGFTGDVNNLDGSNDDDEAPAAEQGVIPLSSNMFLDSRWSFDVLGYVPINRVNLSIHAYGREGNPSPAVLRLNPGDGKTRALQVDEFDGFRLDPLFQLDVRLSTNVNVGGLPLTLNVDAFNLLGGSTPISVDRNPSSTTFGRPATPQVPFSLRFGGKIGF